MFQLSNPFFSVSHPQLSFKHKFSYKLSIQAISSCIMWILKTNISFCFMYWSGTDIYSRFLFFLFSIHLILNVICAILFHIHYTLMLSFVQKKKNRKEESFKQLKIKSKQNQCDFNVFQTRTLMQSLVFTLSRFYNFCF